MAKYKARITTEVVTESKQIDANGFSGIMCKNTGDAVANIYDNIVIEPGDTFSWINDPDVIIGDSIRIAFDSNANKQLMLMKIYNDLI